MSNPKKEEGLKREVDVAGLTLTIVNGTIGAGIFALPAIISIALGAFGIFSYLFCSIMMAAILLCYAEIGSRITTSGGSYAYVEAAFGTFPAYIINWLYFFGWSVLGSAALMNIIADSMATMFPIFYNSLARAFFFFIIIGFIVLVNIRGVKQGVNFIKWITIIKLFPLFAIILFGFSRVEASNLYWNEIPSLKTFSNTALLLFFAFAGFETSLSVSGEIKNPTRTVPLGILFGGSIVFIIYVLIQTVAQGVIGLQMEAFKAAPLAAVAEQLIGPIGGTILLITAIISTFGNVSADVLSTPRLLFAGANDGIFPKFLTKIHAKFFTPHIAVITYASLIFLFSITGGFKQLASLASGAILIVYLSVILATIKLRNNPQSALEKSFRAPGGLIIPIIGILSILWLLTSLSQIEVISIIILILVTCLFYIAIKKVQKL
ncbi:MAG: amino acid permease [Saprospiraceae bacterium]|uniref:Amino acid permease n=1 Tax=Candidatus Defluviibacterium haderslevense TaxID=2981993 RepID=A0A9D7SA71_9BACT|nr:amino acid permease [Candidatus Defluviibacterium haderslevense]